MPAVVLDSEAVSVLANRSRGTARERVRVALTAAARLGLPVRVPAAVLVELYRGNRADAAIDRLLDGRGIGVVTTGRAVARVAGQLRHRDRLDSCHVVDCFLVATAVRLGGGLVVTADGDDLSRRARAHPNVRIHDIGRETSGPSQA